MLWTSFVLVEQRCGGSESDQGDFAPRNVAKSATVRDRPSEPRLPTYYNHRQVDNKTSQRVSTSVNALIKTSAVVETSFSRTLASSTLLSISMMHSVAPNIQATSQKSARKVGRGYPVAMEKVTILEILNLVFSPCRASHT